MYYRSIKAPFIPGTEDNYVKSLVNKKDEGYTDMSHYISVINKKHDYADYYYDYEDPLKLNGKELGIERFYNLHEGEEDPNKFYDNIVNKKLSDTTLKTLTVKNAFNSILLKMIPDGFDNSEILLVNNNKDWYVRQNDVGLRKSIDNNSFIKVRSMLK